jgi:hypothetical protein
MPLKKWGELQKSDAFKKLDPDSQEKARVGYFEQRVAPNVSPEKLPELRKQWDARTGLARPATPAPGVAKPNANLTTPQAMTRPATAQQAAPQQNTAQANPSAIERPGAPEGKGGLWEGVKDFGRGVAKGTVQGLPEAAAGMLDFADTPTFDEQGNNLNDDGEFSKFAREVREGAEKRGENWQQSEFGKFEAEDDAFSARGAAFQAGEMTPLSFGLTIGGAVLGGLATKSLAGARAGASIGGLASLPLFFGHEAKSSYDQVYAEQKAQNPDMTDEDAHDLAMEAGGLTGSIEAGGELIADRVGLTLFKHLPGPVKKDLVKQSTKAIQGIVPMIKGMAKVLGVEVGTELAQGSAQAEVMQEYGVGGGAKWDEQKRVIMPTILMSLVGGGASMGIAASERYKMASLLQNPKAPPQDRANAAQQIAGAVAQEDAELGKMFLDYAMPEIAAGRPVIAQDDRFYRDVKPLDQRSADKEMAGTPDVAKQAEEVAPAQSDFQEVDDNGEPIIVDPEGNAAAPGQSKPGPDISNSEKITLMNELDTQLNVTRSELKAAQAAGNEEQVAELETEIQAIAANFKRISTGNKPLPTPRQQAEKPQPVRGEGEKAWEAGAITKPAEEGEPRAVLQNRDRSSPASVEQMAAIASGPDYTRLGFSRDFANGAPVVEPGAQLDPRQLGREEVATTAAGRQIPVQYAVIEADQLLPSNRVDGTQVAEYAEGAPGMSRAIAGNGRVAGIQSAHEQGNAEDYKEGMAEDAALHGVDADVIRGMENPVLVRVMPTGEITDTIGDESNTSGVAELSPAEQARNDTKRIDIQAVELDDSGEPSAQAVEQFIASMPAAEKAGLLDGTQPNRRAYDRLGNAVFAQAFESDELLRLAAEATDPEMKNIMAGLKIAAGKLSKLKGAGDYDIRALVVEAAETAVNAKRQGQNLTQFLEQADMGRNPYVVPILEMMAANSRSAKQIGAQLSALADLFYAEASRPENDMFGDVEKRPPQQLMDEVYGTGRINTEGEEGAIDAGGAEPTQGSDGEQAAVTPVEEGAQEAGQERPVEPESVTDSQELAADVTNAPTDNVTEVPAEAAPEAEPEKPVVKAKPSKKSKKPKKPKTKLEDKVDSIDAEIDAAAAELAALLKPKPGTLNTGVDPQILLVGTKLGSLYIKKGMVKFAQWAQAIIQKMREMGVEADQIKPHLKEIYAATQQRATDEEFDAMDDAKTVRGFDLDTLTAEEAKKPEKPDGEPDPEKPLDFNDKQRIYTVENLDFYEQPDGSLSDDPNPDNAEYYFENLEALQDEFGEGQWQGEEPAAAPAVEPDGQATMFGPTPVAEQTLADKQKEKDDKRNGTQDVTADIDGGLFSNQQSQIDIEQTPAAPAAPVITMQKIGTGTTALGEIVLSREVQVEETGEIVTIDETAEQVWGRHMKRGNVLKSLLECVQ